MAGMKYDSCSRHVMNGVSDGIAASHRDQVLTDIWHTLDTAELGKLQSPHLKLFAEAAQGYKGDDHDWEQKFRQWSIDYGVNPDIGFDFGQFCAAVSGTRSGELLRYMSEDDLLHAYHVLQERKGASVRARRIRRLFESCDSDGNGRLHEEELLTFAIHSGFYGSARDWSQGYERICVDRGIYQLEGIDLKHFESLVNNMSCDSRYYCTNAQLITLTSSPVMTSRKESVDSDARDDQELKRSLYIEYLFHALQWNPGLASNRLTAQEMETFAVATGFDGNRDEWEDEFERICNELSADPYYGLSCADFRRFVDDRSGRGVYLTDEQIRRMTVELAAFPADPWPWEAALVYARRLHRWAKRMSKPRLPLAATPRPKREMLPVESSKPASREDLMQALFKELDRDCDDRLNSYEMLKLARETDYWGSDVDFEEEYHDLCAEHNLSPTTGIPYGVFQLLVNDKSAAGVYMSDPDMMWAIHHRRIERVPARRLILPDWN